MIDKNESVTESDWYFIDQTRSQGQDFSGVENTAHQATIRGKPITLSHKLAKELIQNVMDVPLDPKTPPKISYNFSNPPLDPSTTPSWFEGINKVLLAGKDIDKEELVGTDSDYRGKDIISSEIPYLVVSDYFTTGLEGDWYRKDKKHFYQLQYMFGRTNKKHGEAGSKGIGTIILTDASKIGAYLFHSIRNSDKVALIHGRASLFDHEIQDVEYTREGYWGIPTPNKKKNTRPLYTKEPNDIPTITKFKNDFNINRSDNNTGTDFIILMPKDEIEKEIDIIIKTAAVIYTRAFVLEKIELEVIKPDKSKVVINDYKSLKEYVDNADWDETSGPDDHILGHFDESKRYSLENHIKNIEEQETAEPDEIIGPLENQNKKGIDKTSFDKIFSVKKEDVRERLNQKGFVTLQFPVKFKLRDHRPIIDDSFSLTLQSIDPEEQGYINCIREVTTIPAERKTLDKGLSATIILKHENSTHTQCSIAELMKSFEDANHLSWNDTNPDNKEKKKYVNYTKLCDLVLNVGKWVSQALDETPVDNSEMWSLGLDFLNRSQEGKKGLSPDITSRNKPEEKIESKNHPWNANLDAEEGKLIAKANRIWKHQDYKDNIKIEVILENITADGKKIANTSVFNLLDPSKHQKLEVTPIRCKWKPAGENKLHFYELQHDWKFEIQGFDNIRDTYASINIIK